MNQRNLGYMKNIDLEHKFFDTFQNTCLKYDLVVLRSHLYAIDFGNQFVRFIIANSDYDYITLIIYVDGVEYNSHLFFTLFEELIEQLKEKNFKLLTGDKYIYGLLYFYRTIVEYMCENKLYLDLSWVKKYIFWSKIGDFVNNEGFEFDEEYIKIRRLYYIGDLTYRPLILQYFEYHIELRNIFTIKYLLNNEWVV